MYSTPLFDFSLNPYCLLYLSTLILPHRMHCITRVNYCWDCRRRGPRLSSAKPDHFTQIWTGTLTTLARMQGLKDLRLVVMIDPPGHLEWIAAKEQIVKSMEGMRSREFQRFELTGLPYEIFEERAPE